MRRMLTTALPLLALCVLASCAYNTEKTSRPPADTTYPRTKGGAAIVETYTTTATVTAVDAQNRKVTLAGSDGRKSTYKADKQVVTSKTVKVGNGVDVAKVSPGDDVTAQVTEAVAIVVEKP